MCFSRVLQRNAAIRDRETHTQLRNDLVEHTPSVPRKNAIHEFKIFPTKNAKVAYQPITPGLGWGPTPTAPAVWLHETSHH